MFKHHLNERIQMTLLPSDPFAAQQSGDFGHWRDILQCRTLGSTNFWLVLKPTSCKIVKSDKHVFLHHKHKSSIHFPLKFSIYWTAKYWLNKINTTAFTSYNNTKSSHICYNKWTIKNYIQQNSTNPNHTAADRCQIIIYSGLSGGNYTEQSS